MKIYTYPTDINATELRARADRRRSALIAAGSATYELGYRDNEPRIVCLCCGLGTSNSNDIRERYCGFCRHWHNEGEPIEIREARALMLQAKLPNCPRCGLDAGERAIDEGQTLDESIARIVVVIAALYAKMDALGARISR